MNFNWREHPLEPPFGEPVDNFRNQGVRVGQAGISHHSTFESAPGKPWIGPQNKERLKVILY